MPILSYLYEFVDVHTCCAYIHRLRWKDRPLQCLRRWSHDIAPWGTSHYQTGLKRYRCKEKACKRTFSSSVRPTRCIMCLSGGNWSHSLYLGNN